VTSRWIVRSFEVDIQIAGYDKRRRERRHVLEKFCELRMERLRHVVRERAVDDGDNTRRAAARMT